MLAQLGLPDMRGPIAVALEYPRRLPLDVPRLDLAAVGRLDFETPDSKRFPCLELAFAALAADEAAPAVLNAANEVAVAAFLVGEIPFPGIAAANAAVLDAHVSAAGPIAACATSTTLRRRMAGHVRTRRNGSPRAGRGA